jgi:hypothetical protein
MPRFYWKDGAWRDRDGVPMDVPVRQEVCMPYVQSDIEDYRSPIDGKVIGSRSHQRYDLEKNGCVLLPPRKKPRGYINPRFAAKRGLPLREDWEEERARLDARARPPAPKE